MSSHETFDLDWIAIEDDIPAVNRMYLGLFAGDPTEGGTEVMGAGYFRHDVSFLVNDTHARPVRMVVPNVAWRKVTHFGVFTGYATTDLIGYGTVNSLWEPADYLTS